MKTFTFIALIIVVILLFWGFTEFVPKFINFSGDNPDELAEKTFLASKLRIEQRQKLEDQKLRQRQLMEDRQRKMREYRARH